MPLVAQPSPGSQEHGFIQKTIRYLGKQDIQEKLKRELVDPVLNHVMKRVFPYIILICVLFVLLLLVVLLTLGVIIFQMRSMPGFSNGVAGVAAAAAVPNL